MEQDSQNVPLSAQDSPDLYAKQTQYAVAPVAAHTHNGTDSLQIDIGDISRFPSNPVQGTIVYYNGNQWVALSPGTSGQFLETLGASANPVWATVTGKFGGTGVDGALSVTATTTIDLGNAAVVTLNYTTISITGTGQLKFSNPNANGSIVILKSQGAVTLTSSTNPLIDMKGIGAPGGAGSGAVTTLPSSAGTDGSDGKDYGNTGLSTARQGKGGTDGGAAAHGGNGGSGASSLSAGTDGGSGAGNSAAVPTAGTAWATLHAGLLQIPQYSRSILLSVGAGGGGGSGGGGTGGAGGASIGGAGGTSTTPNGTASPDVTTTGNRAAASGGGGGGAGAGGLYIECGGAWNFTGGISATGANGAVSGACSVTAATAGSNTASGGGGGAGSGATVVVFYNTLTSNAGTITVTGGTGGGGGNATGATGGNNFIGGTGGNGGNGFSLVVQNTIFF